VTPGSTRRVWIVGPVAWDTVVYLPQLPAPGRFTQGERTLERPGGTAGNVALALATTGVETGFIGCLGEDDHGRRLHQTLQSGGLRRLAITWVPGHTHHVLILVDRTGERTMVGLAPHHLAEVTLDGADLAPGDIVVFVVWDDGLLAQLELAKAKGCTTIVGLAAIACPAASADIAFGSRSDLSGDLDPSSHLDRFPRIVITQGSDGAVQVEAGRTLHQPAFPADVVDTTGAGDAFLAGYLALYARGLTDGTDALEAGARWAALTVSVESSVPPAWSWGRPTVG